MLQSGSDLKTVGAILGHTDESMTMRYSHATVQSKARAVGSLERSKSATAGVKVDSNSTAETE
jgi:integrase